MRDKRALFANCVVTKVFPFIYWIGIIKISTEIKSEFSIGFCRLMEGGTFARFARRPSKGSII